MFVLQHLLNTFAWLLGWILSVYVWLIILRVVLNWANADPYNNIVKGVEALTEPVLRPFRKILPSWKAGGWDLSPVFAILAIEILRQFLVPTLYDLAARL